MAVSLFGQSSAFLMSREAHELLGIAGVIGRGLVLSERLCLISLGRRSRLIQKIAFLASASFYAGEVRFTAEDLKKRLTVTSFQQVWQKGIGAQDWIRVASDVMLFCWSALSLFLLGGAPPVYMLLCDSFCMVGYGCAMHVKTLPALSQAIGWANERKIKKA